jgi:hypothetical protein
MIEKEEDGQRRQRKSRRTSKADAAKLKPTLFVGSLSKSRRSWERAGDILRKNLPADPPKDTMWQERQAPDIATKRDTNMALRVSLPQACPMDNGSADDQLTRSRR